MPIYPPTSYSGLSRQFGLFSLLVYLVRFVHLVYLVDFVHLVRLVCFVYLVFAVFI